jgi:outer membrane immunogenic protein
MKKLLLSSLILATVALPAGSAIAADLDLPPPPPPVTELRPATYDWTGFYVGAWTGVACADAELIDNSGAAAVNYEMSGCGYKGGVMGGYNHQFNEWVLGMEVDWGMSGTIATNEEAGADFSFGFDHIATARAKVGYAFDDTLFFATGGAAWARGDIDGIIAATPDHIRANQWGWVIGGGVEHAVTDQFRLRFDYLFTKFDNVSYSEACCDLDTDWRGEHEFRLGAIWAF